MTYQQFISYASSKNLLQYIQWIYDEGTGSPRYFLTLWDGGRVEEVTVTETADISDFETKYKNSSNLKIFPIEGATGWLKTRPRKLGGDVQLNFIYFTTCVPESLDSGDNTEYTMAVSEDATTTVIDFNPSHSYEVSGGGVCIIGYPAQKTFKMRFIAAPDIPAEYGGSFVFVNNKKFTGELDKFVLSDVDAKLFRYHESTPTANKLRLEIVHDANERADFEFYLLTTINV